MTSSSLFARLFATAAACSLLSFALISSAAAQATSWLCENTCQYAFDNECDDGGPDSLYDLCPLGTDCADCGPRSVVTEWQACSVDADCPEICDTARGVCVGCRSRADCGHGAYCNQMTGQCYEPEECADEADCGGAWCDTDTNTCIPCERDAQCGYAQFCNTATGLCYELDECRSDADCLNGCDIESGYCVRCTNYVDCR